MSASTPRRADVAIRESAARETGAERWVRPLGRNANAKGRLFCFPYAGGGAALFASWSRMLPRTLEVCGMQPPGRPPRLDEPPIRRMEELVRAAVDALEGALTLPYWIFGHSMGAIVAFEVARELRRRGAPEPTALLVSAAPAPHLTRDRASTHRLPDAELIAELRRMDGTPPELLDDREAMAVVLPALRADFEAYSGYGYRDEAPLDCPIVAFAGSKDSLVAAERTDGWRRHTRAEFGLHVIEGGHFFLNTRRSELVGRIRDVQEAG